MNTFPKCERVYGNTAVGTLMSEGKWGSSEQLRYCWLKRPESEINRVMVSVPKKFFKRAVKRNLLKRRIREAYRLNKALLEIKGFDVLFAYSTKEVLDYKTIEAEVIAILNKLNKK